MSDRRCVGCHVLKSSTRIVERVIFSGAFWGWASFLSQKMGVFPSTGAGQGVQSNAQGLKWVRDLIYDWLFSIDYLGTTNHELQIWKIRKINQNYARFLVIFCLRTSLLGWNRRFVSIKCASVKIGKGKTGTFSDEIGSFSAFLKKTGGKLTVFCDF